ncbi:TPA: YopX family protein [Streptococcus suis]
MIPKYRVACKNKILGEVGSIDFIDETVTVPVFDSETGEYLAGYELGLNQVVLMQSTGLFDTFCQDELFEDDVILWTYFDEWEDSGNARIVHRDGCWKLLDIETGKEVWDTLFDCLENCSVYLAGNIYENPELLEVNND